jgi:hypothetical protein
MERVGSFMLRIAQNITDNSIHTPFAFLQLQFGTNYQIIRHMVSCSSDVHFQHDAVWASILNTVV